MPRDRRTHGYPRLRDVPSLEGTSPKVCKKCDNWFAALPRRTVCDGCTLPFLRSKRASLGNHTGEGSSVGIHAGQRGVKSGFLGVLFRPRVSEWRILTLEAAAWIDTMPEIRSYRPPWDGGKTLYRDKPIPRVTPAPGQAQEGPTEPVELYAKRASALRDFISAGNKARDFAYYPEMTAREVSVAIGWIPWPKSWPQPASTAT